MEKHIIIIPKIELLRKLVAFINSFKELKDEKENISLILRNY